MRRAVRRVAEMMSRGFWVVIAAFVLALELYALSGVAMGAWLTAVPGYSQANAMRAFYSWSVAAAALFIILAACIARAVTAGRVKRV